MGDLVPWPGIELGPSALGVRVLASGQPDESHNRYFCTVNTSPRLVSTISFSLSSQALYLNALNTRFPFSITAHMHLLNCVSLTGFPEAPPVPCRWAPATPALVDPPGLHSTEAPGALVQEEALGQTAWALRLHSDVLSLTTGHSKPLWLGFLMYKIRDETLQTSDEVLRTTHVNNCKGAEQRWHLGSRRGLLAARGGSRPWRATGSRLAPCQKQLQNWKNTQNYFQTLAYRWHRVWFLKAEQTQAPQSLHSTYKGTSGTPEQETEPTLCVLGLLSWRHKDWSLGAGRLRQQTPVDQRTKEGEATQSNLHGAPFGGLLTCTQTSWDLKRQDGNPLPGEGQLRRHCRWN